MSADLLQSDIDRVYNEYAEARAAFEASDPEAPEHSFVRARWQRAQINLREARQMWREIGEAAGVRTTFAKVEDNSPPPPDLIGIHIQGKGEAGTPAQHVDNNVPTEG